MSPNSGEWCSTQACVCVCVCGLASDWADGEDGVHSGDKGGVTSVLSLAFVFVCACVRFLRVSLGFGAAFSVISTNKLISKLRPTRDY